LVSLDSRRLDRLELWQAAERVFGSMCQIWLEVPADGEALIIADAWPTSKTCAATVRRSISLMKLIGIGTRLPERDLSSWTTHGSAMIV
jgi:hypothetical protein